MTDVENFPYRYKAVPLVLWRFHLLYICNRQCLKHVNQEINDALNYSSNDTKNKLNEQLHVK